MTLNFFFILLKTFSGRYPAQIFPQLSIQLQRHDILPARSNRGSDGGELDKADSRIMTCLYKLLYLCLPALLLGSRRTFGLRQRRQPTQILSDSFCIRIFSVPNLSGSVLFQENNHVYGPRRQFHLLSGPLPMLTSSSFVDTALKAF